ncbi:MAG: hypothetical protein ACP5KW_10565, partial [Thermoproteota archaeon]
MDRKTVLYITLIAFSVLAGIAFAQAVAPSQWFISQYTSGSTNYTNIYGSLGYSLTSISGVSSSRASSLSYATQLVSGVSSSQASSLSYATQLVSGVSSSRASSLGYSLAVLVNYGGSFYVNKTYVVNPIVSTSVASNKDFLLNITVWSPYGIVDYLAFNLSSGSNLVKFLYNGSLYKTYDPNNFFNLVSYTKSTNTGWVYFKVTLTPSWSAGYPFNVSVLAKDTTHGYSGSATYTSLFSVINKTALKNYSFNSTVYSPSAGAKLDLNIVYNTTSVGANSETLFINGTQLLTNGTGFATYTFTAPSTSGNYVLNVTLAHGKTYFLNFSVSSYTLNILVNALNNYTIHFPSQLTYYVYNYTSGALLKTVSGSEKAGIALDGKGVYTVKVFYKGIKVVEFVHNQTNYIQNVVEKAVNYVRDSAGSLRGLISNVSLTVSYNNSSRKLFATLSGSGKGRLIYIVNSTKPLLVLCNTTASVSSDGKEIIVDANLPANITIVDPRKLKVIVKNPYNVSFTPSIKFLNISVYETINNGTMYTVPSSSSSSVIVSFKGAVQTQSITLLDDLNLTLPFTYLTAQDYKKKSREFVANVSVNIENLSPFSYSNVKITSNKSFDLRIYIPLPPTKLSISSNTTISYSFSNGWLNITGRAGSTAVVNITDLYKVSVDVRDMLERSLSFVPITINSSVVQPQIFMPPAYYNFSFPQTKNYFKFSKFSDGYSSASRIFTVNNSDVYIKVYYRVPISFKS